MAEPPVNNELPVPREDGHTASDSESNNGRGSGARQATSVRRPSPRRAAAREVSPHRATSRVPSPRRTICRIPSPRRIASKVHIPVLNREPRSAYDIMGIVTGQLGRLDRFESNYARQMEVEEQLRQEKAWRKKTEEKLKKMETEMKKSEGGKLAPQHSDQLFTT
ncbi:hypothetical protein PIB30_019091 [Stylosanthes scabra]|uniref:Pinin/SDK/MemA protein domain-containing protein n=1 Tax=Stylosanthes scabra TaxID=79078 RepID=A0ABU6U7C8_9FABA|nr:hypothetical protein [Stylosanthes scabra]